MRSPIIDDHTVGHLSKHYLQHTRTANASCSALSSRQVSVYGQHINKSSGAILRYPSKGVREWIFLADFRFFRTVHVTACQASSLEAKSEIFRISNTQV